MNKTIVIIDASSLKNSHCILKFFNDTYIGYKEHTQDSVLCWGSAFHKFRAYYRETKQALVALKIAQAYFSNTPMVVKDNKKYLNSTFLTDVCLQYETKYENDSFETVVNPHTKKNLIEPETRFAFPFIIEPDIEILCAGTMDEIGKWRGGKYCIVDCKTSVTWKIREFFTGYKLDPQMLMYRWTLKKVCRTTSKQYMGRNRKN
jgi:ATP-dependent exoDNAse (exonuclease V) beta subunit